MGPSPRNEIIATILLQGISGGRWISEAGLDLSSGQRALRLNSSHSDLLGGDDDFEMIAHPEKIDPRKVRL
jgi:hypothetical protein